VRDAAQPLPLPAGFRIALDPSARQLRDDLWFGGAPPRVVRLTPSGQRAWHELQHDPVRSAPAGALARRLTDAGLAHPIPPSHDSRADLVVIVPVRDRARELDRCLSALGDAHPVVVVDDGSDDADRIRTLCSEHGARVVRRSTTGGPAAARNTGLDETTSDFVAFVDSDCEPPHGWLDGMLAHLDDPLVAAAAPRIIPHAPRSWSGRYTVANGSLDLGPAPARVAPRTRVSYVPTAALVARRGALAAIAHGGAVFDESMRVGEDVDLVWRLHAAGWRIRYEPAVTVPHREPEGWPDLLRRRFRYGTSAAPLARRHPDELAPLVVAPWPTLAVLALLARRPVLATATFGTAVAATAHKLRSADVPTAGLLPAVARTVPQTFVGLGRFATQFAGPVLIAAALLHGRAWRRVAAAALLFAGPLGAWLRARPDLDPIRFTVGSVADEIAYGSGVLAGCARHCTLVPIRPVIVRRALRIDKAEGAGRR
jgi:mycofactocin glycosyltransferase